MFVQISKNCNCALHFFFFYVAQKVRMGWFHFHETVQNFRSIRKLVKYVELLESQVFDQNKITK